jgi:hypothetical protein
MMARRGAHNEKAKAYSLNNAGDQKSSGDHRRIKRQNTKTRRRRKVSSRASHCQPEAPVVIAAYRTLVTQADPMTNATEEIPYFIPRDVGFIAAARQTQCSLEADEAGHGVLPRFCFSVFPPQSGLAFPAGDCAGLKII